MPIGSGFGICGCGSAGRASPCQGEGREFESRHPLQESPGQRPYKGRWPAFSGSLRCPRAHGIAHVRDACSMDGSIRQRSAGSWELRAYVGVDPETGRRIDRSITVRGNRSDAERELAKMVARVRCVRAVGARSTMSELFEAWFATAVDGWSPTTVRQNRSVLDRHLHRHIGSMAVGDVTPASIDALYGRLRRGDDAVRPLAAATVARIHVVVSSALSQAMRVGQPCVTVASDRCADEGDAPSNPA